MTKSYSLDEIQYVEKFIPDALHGTDIASYNHILKQGFKHSTGEDQFLGDGVYFWEGSYLLALRWAIRRAKRNHLNEYVIIIATIDLGICLDLLKPEHLEIVQKVAQKLKETTSKSINDAIVLNFIDHSIQKLDTIRAIHPETRKNIFDKSKFLSNVEPLICVKNTKNILSFSLQEQDNI